METKTPGALPYSLLPGWGEGGSLGSRGQEGGTAEGGQVGWCESTFFFKKKIITIYLHPGGQGREEEVGWAGSIYKGHGGEGEGVVAWGRGGDQGGRRSSYPQIPCPSFSSLPTTS